MTTAVAAPREEAEIAVVGAGPAGCVAAANLAELGHDVLLIDKDSFPREKPCGDGLGHAAVAVAERLGLDELVESAPEIASARVMIGHRRQSAIHFPRIPGRPLPRCITRKEFDAALLGAAQERGARFLRARVDSLRSAGRGQTLIGTTDAGAVAVRARLVVAADGATSRLRRVIRKGADKPTAYAIRRYFRTERPLDEVMQIDVPLEIDGRVLAGYGWVFPVGEHLANIGVGITREAHRPVPSLRRLLEAYVADLEVKGGRRFGSLEPIADPMGSPVGIQAQIQVAESPGLALLGDAAGTTHPVTGEGISFAMRGGESLAAEIHARSRRGGPLRLGRAAGAAVWRSFPQIGVDVSIIVRALMLKANGMSAPADSLRSSGEPFLSAAWRVTPQSAYETAVEETPVCGALAEHDPSLATALGRVNDLLLERLSDSTPFVTEVIHDLIRAHMGPVYAAVALASGASAGPPPSTAYDAGVAVETVAVMPKLLTMLVDRARTKQLKINNAMAILTGDFAATRSLVAAAKLGPAAVAALSRTCQGGCEGGMRDAVARFATDRSAASWHQAACETEGAGMILATEFGALIRGEDLAAAEPLRAFGQELGIAVRLAEEIVELTVGDELRPGREGAALGRGIYSLPVLYALEAEPSLARTLVRHAAEPDGAAEIIAVVRDSGALRRAVAECTQRAEAARSCAEAWGGRGAEPLAAVALLPAQYVNSRLPVDALEVC